MSRRGLAGLLQALGLLLPGMVAGALLGWRAWFALGSTNRDSLAPAIFGLAAGLLGATVGGVLAAVVGRLLERLANRWWRGAIAPICALLAGILLWILVHALAARGIDAMAQSRLQTPPVMHGAESAGPPCSVDPATLSERDRRSWESECR